MFQNDLCVEVCFGLVNGAVDFLIRILCVDVELRCMMNQFIRQFHAARVRVILLVVRQDWHCIECCMCLSRLRAIAMALGEKEKFLFILFQAHRPITGRVIHPSMTFVKSQMNELRDSRSFNVTVAVMQKNKSSIAAQGKGAIQFSDVSGQCTDDTVVAGIKARISLHNNRLHAVI